MLDRIIIDNFATIEHAEVDFNSSLNVITGESGAGKSVLIEAINMALGGRADISMVRSGKEKALIQILAHDNNDNEIIISRELFSSGKSLSKLNGQLITLSELRNFCYSLVDVHGQYDNQKLLNPETHISMLDSYISDNINDELDSLENLYLEYQGAKKKYDTLISEEKESIMRQDYFQFEFDYINNLNLKVGEEEALRESVELMKNSEKIFSSISETYSYLNGSDSSAVYLIGKSLNLMKDVSSYTDTLSEISNTLENSYYELEDASSSLLSLRDSMYFSENELNDAQERLSEIEDAMRKYKMSVQDILKYKDELKDKLTKLTDFEYLKSRYKKDMEDKFSLLSSKAELVSEIRAKYGEKLKEEISLELKDLNFTNSDFEVKISRKNTIDKLGFDDVEFLISTNPGEPLMPLAKIASGGEISRIMLSFKYVIGDKYNVPTMIFDEIDSGISGKSALVVGKKLREIAKFHQVICITHLPQIAIYGKFAYRISKDVLNGRTFTSIKELNDDEKVKNIAMMISGSDDSKAGLKMAKELISSIS